MDVSITDGGAKGVRATVSTFKRLNVSAKEAPRIFYQSRDEGQSYNATSVISSLAAGSIAFYIKNTSTTRNLFIERMEFHGDNDYKWLVWGCTGTPAGTILSPANLNRGSNLNSETLVYGDAAVTGLTLTDRIATHRSQAGGEGEMNFFNALFLPPNTAFCIELEAGTTGSVEIDCLYHFETVGAG